MSRSATRTRRRRTRTSALVGSLSLGAVGILAAAVVLTGIDPGADRPQPDDTTQPEVVPAAVGRAPVPDPGAPVGTPVQAADDQVLDEPTMLPLATYEVFLSRDPFEPVVPEEPDPAADADPDTNGDDGPGTGTGTGTGGGSADGGTTNGGTTPVDDGCRGRQEVVCNGQVVTVVDITTDADGRPIAVVQVDTTLYEVAVGQRFASNFEVRAIDGSCVSLLFGDDGFQLCVGDRVLK